METENIPNNTHKQISVILSTNQIKLYTHTELLEENPLLRKLLNSVSTTYLLDETFYHRHIPLFSKTISAGTVIKATQNLTCITSSIIHMTW